MPQRSVLGPILFLLYVNDMSNCVGEDGLRIFADDTNVFVSGNSIETITLEVETKLRKLDQWFQANHLTLNIDKTMYTLFTNKKMCSIRNPKLNNIEISRVPSVKYR